MSLRLPRGIQSTAAWRISVWTTLAFAIGSAFAFAIVYMLVARDADARRDVWLQGEAGTLAEVAAKLPRDASYARRMQEMAEFATRDVLQEHTSHLMPGEDAVFFLNDGPGCPTVWVGPSAQGPFLQAIEAARLSTDVPQPFSHLRLAVPFLRGSQNSGSGLRILPWLLRCQRHPHDAAAHGAFSAGLVRHGHARIPDLAGAAPIAP